MESHPSITDRPIRIPLIAWFLGIGLIAALVAIFVFNVAINTVAYYGFFALMIGSHFFMHGSHAGHGGHTGNTGQQAGTASNPSEVDKNEHAGHSGGCH
ncbi:MAG: hypothetical protein ACYC6R_02440 [Anaerolineales bacterium]